MDESAIYIAVTTHLKNEGWELLGGQPPSGSDHLPVIEIKDPLYAGKGSKGALKPDLIARKDLTVLIIELKPRFSKSDLHKLLQLLSSPNRINAFWNEIEQRDIRLKDGMSINQLASSAKVEGALGFSGPPGNLQGLRAFLVDPSGAVSIHCQSG